VVRTPSPDSDETAFAKTAFAKTAFAKTAFGETPFEGGFHRVSPGPEPLALARLRGLLLAVASGGSDQLRVGLEGFQSWRSLATLCGTEWTAGARRGSAAARRLLQRRLRALGTAPIPVSRAAELPPGSSVHVRGTIRPVLPTGAATGTAAGPVGGLKSHIWSQRTMNTDNVRGAVEEGHDFFLTDDLEPAGKAACVIVVIVARGHLINADELLPGDRVSVFGFTDSVAARGASQADPFDRASREPALRAGDDLPLLIRRLSD
jgi:hypothetical protein